MLDQLCAREDWRFRMNQRSSTATIAEDNPYLHGRIPAIDGLRALSISCVLLAHGLHSEHLVEFSRYCGSVGVRFFFVISGFLITWLLLREKQHYGSISLGAFYKRRAIRILPVYYAFLLAVFLLTAAGIQEPISNLQWLLNLTFTANYGPLLGPTGVLWSLGVEEQFYLLWPASLIFLLKRGETFTFFFLVVVLAIPPVLRLAAHPYFFGPDFCFPALHRFSFLLQMDNLAWGCLGAILLWRHPSLLEIQKHKIVAAFLASFILLLVTYFIPLVPIFGKLSIPFNPSLQSLSMIIILVCAIAKAGRPFTRLMESKPLVFLGTISYSLYLWHSLFISPSKNSFFIYIGLSVLVAACSYSRASGYNSHSSNCLQSDCILIWDSVSVSSSWRGTFSKG